VAKPHLIPKCVFSFYIFLRIGKGSTRAQEEQGARRSKKEQEGARRSKKEQEGARRSKKEQEGARRSKKEQEGARRSKKEQGARRSKKEQEGARKKEQEGARLLIDARLMRSFFRYWHGCVCARSKAFAEVRGHCARFDEVRGQ